MPAMAGNEPGFEEAARALFAGSPERFDEQTKGWPVDVRDHARTLAAAGFYAVSREGPGLLLPALAGFWIACRLLICNWGGLGRAE